MLYNSASETWLKPKNEVNTKVPSRGIAPICAPPRFPFTTMQKVLYGGGSMLIMMIIPLWGLLSIPSWAIKHQNLGKGRKTDEDE